MNTKHALTNNYWCCFRWRLKIFTAHIGISKQLFYLLLLRSWVIATCIYNSLKVTYGTLNLLSKEKPCRQQRDSDRKGEYNSLYNLELLLCLFAFCMVFLQYTINSECLLFPLKSVSFAYTLIACPHTNSTQQHNDHKNDNSYRHNWCKQSWVDCNKTKQKKHSLTASYIYRKRIST